MKNFTVGSIATILFLVALSVNAQSIIKGKITTSDGKPAVAVTIQLKEVKKATVSLEDGSYMLQDIAPGKYTMVISFISVAPQYKTIEVANGQTLLVDFSLQQNASQLNEVVVTYTKSMNEKTAAIGKLAIKPMDLPQSIAVIGKDVLERQQVLHLSDALQNVTGVYVMGNTGGYQEEIAGRGYAFTSNNTFKNGARYNNGAMPEMSGVEKLEFLKGGSAILFGNVAAGGILNIVTKKPKFENGGEISFRTGSYNFYKSSIDIYGALNKNNTAAYRVNTSYETAESFRDAVKSERFYINPSFLFKVGKQTEILVEGDYLKDNRTPDFGIGAINYTITNVPRNRFLGVNWGYNKAQQKNATATITHQLNSNWQIRGTTTYQNYDVELFAAARPSTIQTNGNWIRGLQKSATKEKYFIGQVDVTGKFNTGSIAHNVLIGADADNYNTKSYVYVVNRYNAGSSNAAIRNLNIYDTINIYDPLSFNKRNDIPYLATDRITTSPIFRYGVYAQDLIALTQKIKLLAGVRYSYQNNKEAIVDTVSKSTQGKIAAYTNDAFSPRVGLVYQPIKQMAVFTSYTNTFTVNTGTDIYNQSLPPSIINQFESGIKTDLFQGMLSANLTLYQIINKQFAQTAFTLADGTPNNNSNIKELAGEVTSKGVELDIATKSFHGFVFLAGYSYNDTRYTGGNGKNFNTGDRLRYNPAHTANANLAYNFNDKTALKGLSLGFGAYYVGNRMAGRNPSATNPTYKLIALPDYFLIDASVGYNFQHFSLRGKLTNIANKLSYNVHDDNSVNPIVPTQFAISAAYKF